MLKEMRVHSQRTLGLIFCPDKVPMAMLSEAMAQKNHGQTLDGLNQRGGLGVNEILANIKSERIKPGNETQQDVDELNVLITKWNRQYTEKHTEKDMCDFAKFCFNDWMSAHERNEIAKPTQDLYKKFTTEEAIKRAKSIHGDGYTYERREGTEVDLTQLKKGQSVCAGGNGWHILMTEK